MSMPNRALWLSLPLLLASATPAAPYTRAWDETQIDAVSSVLDHLTPELEAGLHTFYTAPTTVMGGGAPDTILFVLDAITDQVLGANDDCDIPGLTWAEASCVQVDNLVAGTPYRVIAMAKSNADLSSGFLVVSGPTFVHPITGAPDDYAVTTVFGGHTVSGPDVGWEGGDTVHAVRVATSAVPAASDIELYVLTWAAGACGAEDVTLHDTSVRYNHLAQGAQLTLGPPSSDFCKVQLIVGTGGADDVARSARLYVNSAVAPDSDGDGLCDDLEQELGTCAAAIDPSTCPSPPTSATPCCFSPVPWDTDADGISDGAEVLGVPGGVEADLPLPLYGADPLHRDVYLELDWADTTVPVSPQSVLDTIAAYGYGDVLGAAGNPDGAPGLALHVDCGAACGVAACVLGPDCRTDLGDWGGSNQVASEDARNVAYAHVASVRHGIFRYGLKVSTAAEHPNRNWGGSWKWTFHFDDDGTPERRASVLAHELGHALGLWHGGADTLNGKPNYVSTMNYAYSAGHFGMPIFSTGQRAPLVSTSLSEPAGIGPDPSAVDLMYDFIVSGDAIDWNRNGVIDAAPVAGVTRWPDATANGDRGVGSGFVHRNENVLPAAAGTGTALVEYAGELAALFRVDRVVPPGEPPADDLAWSRFDHSLLPCLPGQPGPGCCAVDTSTGGCGSWNLPATVPDGSPIASTPAATVFNLASVGPRVVVAYVANTGGGVLRMAVRHTDAALEMSDELLLPAAVAPSLDHPDPALLNRGGSLYLYYLNADGWLHRARLNSLLQLIDDVVVTDNASGAPLTGTHGPSVAWNGATGKAFLALPASLATPAPGQLELWTEVGDPVFAYLPLSVPDDHVATSRPRLVFNQTYEPHGFQVFFSNSRALLRRAWADETVVNLFQHLGTVTTNFDAGVTATPGIAWYRGHLQALAACSDGAGAWCQEGAASHLPFADGIFPVVEHDYNDFVVMRQRMCWTLQMAVDPEDCSACGPLPPGATECDDLWQAGSEASCFEGGL